MLHRSSSSVTDLSTLEGRHGTSSLTMLGISTSGSCQRHVDWFSVCCWYNLWRILWKKLEYMQAHGEVNLWAHREKLIKGAWKVTGIIWDSSHIAFPCLYLIGISENSFPVAVLLMTSNHLSLPIVGIQCVLIFCWIWVQKCNKKWKFWLYSSLTNWLVFSKSLNPCFLIRTPRHLDYMGCKSPSASSDSLNVWFWVNLVTEMSSDLWSFMSSNP